MLILGIESSSLVASAALVKDGVLLAEYTLNGEPAHLKSPTAMGRPTSRDKLGTINSKKTHSQTLLPMIKEIVDAVLDGDLSGIDGIAISKGPGSFTGLRIGSATAKGLAFTLDKPIMAIPTMDAMAYGLYGAEGLVCPIMDARRKQVYTGLYVFEETNGKYEMKTIIPQTAMDLDELMEFLNSNGQPVIFLGDACQAYEDDILSGMTAPFEFAPSFVARQRASVVAELGAIYLKKGIIETAESHAPEYLKKTQAERERDEKAAAKN